MTIFRLADFLTRRRGLRQMFLFIGPVKTESICRKVTDLYPALASAEYLSVGPADAPTGYPPADFTFATLWMTAYTLLRIRNTGPLREIYEGDHGGVAIDFTRQIAAAHQDWDGEFERVLDFLDEQCTPGLRSAPPTAQPFVSSSAVAPT
jgi:hypothetical protein